MGRPFAALLKISAEFKLEFDFGNADGSGDDSEAPDFSEQTPLGACPKCGGRVFELPMAYVCENAVGPSKRCDFRSGRVILQQTVQAEQMRKLLSEGRTDLLRDFVSNRTRRKFAARLVRKPDGTIGFEFEPRPARAVKAVAPAAEPAEAEEAPRKPSRVTSKKPAKSATTPTRAKAVAPKTAAKKPLRRKTSAKPDKKKPARGVA